MITATRLYTPGETSPAISQAIYFDPVSGSQIAPWAFESTTGIHFFSCPDEAENAYLAELGAEIDAVDEKRESAEQAWV